MIQTQITIFVWVLQFHIVNSLEVHVYTPK